VTRQSLSSLLPSGDSGRSSRISSDSSYKPLMPNKRQGTASATLNELHRSPRPPTKYEPANEGSAAPGIAPPGVATNGVASNGAGLNGVATNGVASNGAGLNGIATNGAGAPHGLAALRTNLGPNIAATLNHAVAATAATVTTGLATLAPGLTTARLPTSGSGPSYPPALPLGLPAARVPPPVKPIDGDAKPRLPPPRFISQESSL
jgi:hypothetical protein